MKKPLNWNIMSNKLKFYLVTAVLLYFMIWFGCNEKTEKQSLDLLSNDPPEVIADTMLEKTSTDTVTSESQTEDNYVSGILETPGSQTSYVSLPMGGMVTEIYVRDAEYVKTGKWLARISHPDYIRLQQNFLESKAKLKYLKEEFRRQGELTIEHASSIKKLQLAESEFLTEEAKYLGLKAQLELLRIDTERLHPDNLVIQLPVIAGSSGYVTAINAKSGKYHQPNDWLFEITDFSKLQVTLLVDEKYRYRFEPEQELAFSVNHRLDSKYAATVQRKSFRINKDGKIKVIAKVIDEPNGQLLPGMTVKCSIPSK